MLRSYKLKSCSSTWKCLYNSLRCGFNLSKILTLLSAKRFLIHVQPQITMMFSFCRTELQWITISFINCNSYRHCCTHIGYVMFLAFCQVGKINKSFTNLYILNWKSLKYTENNLLILIDEVLVIIFVDNHCFFPLLMKYSVFVLNP